MDQFNSKKYPIYANFLNKLAKDLTSFYYSKLNKTFKVSNKLKGKGYDPVTTSDKAFEKFIRSKIKNKFPDHQVIGEEFGHKKSKSDFTWVIDPIDGTRSFVIGNLNWSNLITLNNLITTNETAATKELNRFDRMRSVTISASLAPGYSLGEALDYLDNLALTSLPPEARISYAGQSREFRDSSSSLMITFGLALLVVFLVLAAQFESFVHPIIIMLSVPLAITGALATLYFTGIP